MRLSKVFIEVGQETALFLIYVAGIAWLVDQHCLDALLLMLPWVIGMVFFRRYKRYRDRREQKLVGAAIRETAAACRAVLEG